MITGYTRPQLLIRQVLEVLPNIEARTLHAFAVGPQFDLHRYTNADERAEMDGVIFEENSDTDPAARQVVPYEGLKATQLIDAAFTRLYAEAMEGQLWAAASGGLYDFQIQSLLQPNHIRVIRRQAEITATYGSNGGLGSIVSATLNYGGSGYATSTTIDQPVVGGTGSGAVIRMTTNGSGVVTAVEVVAPGVGYTVSVTFIATAPNTGANVGFSPTDLYPTPLVAELYGRPLQVGDIVYGTLNGTTVRRSITAINPEIVPSKYGSTVASGDKKFAASSINPSKTVEAVFGNGSAPANWGIELAKGIILSVDVTAGGSGYTGAPAVNFDAPIIIYENGAASGNVEWPADEALASASVDETGVVDGVTVDVPGAGYYFGGIVGAKILNGGSGYMASNPPRITVTTPDDGEAATVEPVILAGAIVGIKILDPGYGYEDHPGNAAPYDNDGVTLSGGSGTGAQIVLIANIGAVRGGTITDPGSAYMAAPTAGITGGGGSAFASQVYLGFIEPPPISAGGTGYLVGDIITLVPGTGTAATFRVTSAPGGVVDAIEIVNPGRYTAPSVAPSAATTGGANADLELDLSGGYSIVDVAITNPGIGYTSAVLSITGNGVIVWDLVKIPEVTLTGGGGSGATASLNLISYAVDWSGLVEGSTYDGKYGERYTITVTKSGSDLDDARVRIRSASGAFSANSVVAYHYGRDYIVQHAALGGLAVSLRPISADTALRQGDTFTFTIQGIYLPLELEAAGRLLAINLIAAGSGYTSSVTEYALEIASPPSGGVQATGYALITAGAVASVRIENPGMGYLAAPTVALPVSAGAGTGAVFEGVLTTAEDSRDLTVVQSGVYTGPINTRYQVKVIRGSDLGQAEESFAGALVRVSDSAGIDEIQEYEVVHGVQYALGTYGLRFLFPENQATPSGTSPSTTATADATVAGGVITKIEVTDGGSGYTEPPEVTLLDDDDGAGAIATAVLHQGQVVEIIVTNGGASYGVVTVVIEPPTAYQGGLRTGDTYYLEAVAQSNSGPHSDIVLNGQITDITGWTESDVDVNKLDVDFRALYSGIIVPRRDSAPNLAWAAGTAADGGILVEADLALQVTDRDEDHQWVPFKAADKARLFAHWRGLEPAISSDRIKLYYSEAELVAKFGKNDMDNPVCYGAIQAFRGGQEKPVYAARLATDNLAGHLALIRQAEHVEGIYSICPMSYDVDIKAAWTEHVSKMSLENWKLWRRVYLGVQNPGPYAVLSVQADGTNYEATVTANAFGNVRVVSADGDFLTKNIRPGDLFRTNYHYNEWGDQLYDEFPIYTVSTEDELILESGPTTPIVPAAKFEIWRPDNGLSQAAYAGANSASFNNRRAINVWCDAPQISDAEGNILQVPVYYLAAEVAGLRAALLPQQGLTYTELQSSLDSCPLMFTKYVESELNVAAANGTWIVTQDQEDGPIYIRHQLTTDTSHGILYYEDSIGANLDNVSYSLKDIFQPYIGKRNTNVETLEEMATKARSVLDGFKAVPGGFTAIGPAIINYSKMKISIDPVFKDRINWEVTIEFPLPINTIIATIKGTTASDATISTINATLNAPVSNQNT